MGKKPKAKRSEPKPALPAPRKDVRPRKATEKEALFAKYWAAHKNATRAAKEAGYAPASAHVEGSKLLRKPKVQELIREALDEALAKAQASVDFVTRKWLALGMADARELTQNWRDACRYCYGKDHGYQWTAGEWAKAQEKYRAEQDDYDEGRRKRPPVEPQLQGGLGFDPRKTPNDECPECFGRGVPYQYIADTRHLSEAAATLFAGVKVTDRGIEIKTRDQDAAVTNLAKHLGMLAERHLHGGLPPDFWEKATPEQLKAVAEGKKPV